MLENSVDASWHGRLLAFPRTSTVSGDMKHIASCSFGKDSLAMVLKLLEENYPLDRVSCWCCRNKNIKELKNIYMYLPEYWQKLRGIQSRIDTPFKGEGKSIFDLEERFKKEIENARN